MKLSSSSRPSPSCRLGEVPKPLPPGRTWRLEPCIWPILQTGSKFSHGWRVLNKNKPRLWLFFAAQDKAMMRNFHPYVSSSLASETEPRSAYSCNSSEEAGTKDPEPVSESHGAHLGARNSSQPSIKAVFPRATLLIHQPLSAEEQACPIPRKFGAMLSSDPDRKSK